jgi:hypothetical protein
MKANDSAATPWRYCRRIRPPPLIQNAKAYLACKRILMAENIVCVHHSLRQQTAAAVVQQVSSAVVQQEPSTVGCDLTCCTRR